MSEPVFDARIAWAPLAVAGVCAAINALTYLGFSPSDDRQAENLADLVRDVRLFTASLCWFNVLIAWSNTAARRSYFTKTLT